MSPAVGIGPMVIVPLTFLFVLLIILIVKAPKAGAWVVGGLVLLSPIVLWRFAAAGSPSHPDAIAWFVVPGTFLFVLLIILLTKAPKVGAGIIVALVVMGLFGAMFIGTHHVSGPQQAVSYGSSGGSWAQVSPPSLTPEQRAEMSKWSDDSWAQVSQLTPEQRAVIVMHSGDVKATYDGTHTRLRVSSKTPAPASSEPLSPIWSSGVDQELDADVYPSKLAALQALGLRIDRAVHELMGDVNAPPQITLFQEESDRALIVELKNAIGQILPQATCAIAAEVRNLRPDEVGVTVRVADMDLQPAPWARSPEVKVASGRIELHVSTTAGGQVVHRRFVEKPWLDNFATFASTRPDQAFIIARSTGTCTSEGEARHQAMQEAARQVEQLVWTRRPPELAHRSAAALGFSDLQNGGFIADTFVQSFEGSVGKIWRQAVLLDVSSSNVARLSDMMFGRVRQVRESWARMGLSAAGVVVLIGLIYFFLNMATRGYYEWSLRIAGVILAIVAVLSILMVVR